MLVKKKDALKVESCAMMKVGCHRRRVDERRDCRLLLVAAADAVPMGEHVMCCFLVKRRNKADTRTLGDAHFCGMSPSEMGL